MKTIERPIKRMGEDMSLTINPGTENTEDYGFEQAYNNMIQFIKDSEIDLNIEKASCVSEDGRYSFTLKTSLNLKWSWEVEMPSLPLEQVRYMEEEGQDIWDYPRLYVNGSSWIWCYAIIKKEEVIEMLKDEIEEHEGNIKRNNRLIEGLGG